MIISNIHTGIAYVYLMVGGAGFVESMLSFRSVWEAESVIGVADFDVESLRCDRCR